MRGLGLCIVVALIAPALSMVGVDLLVGVYSADTFKCFKDAGYQFVVAKAYRWNGTPQPTVNQYLAWAKEAGLKTDIEMYNCRRLNATAQVDDMLKRVNQSLYDRLWIELQINPGIQGCQWDNYDSESNCQYADELVARASTSGKKIGVSSSAYSWLMLFGGKTKCNNYVNLDLWYDNFDNNPSFTNFTPFGGWTKPGMKMFTSDQQICGVYANRDYRP